MLQHILSIGSTILQTAKNLNQIRIHSADAALHNCLLACFPDFLFNVFLCFCNHFFDSCRMDASVFYKALKSKTGNFPADWIEAGKDNSLRRIINNKIYAGNISSFAAYDTAFHFFIRKRHYRNGCLRNRISCISLNSTGYDFSGLCISSCLGFFNRISDSDCLFVRQFFIYTGNNHILCLCT